MGNICRSPAGECVMRHLAEESGVGQLFECDSAGTIDLHTGKSPDPRMREAARHRGIAIRGAARQISERDLHEFDLILTMDFENRQYVDFLKERAGECRATVRDFCELCREHDLDEVPDPYYGGQDGFDQVMDLLQDGCAGLLEEIRA